MHHRLEALAQNQADLIIANAKLVNVLSGEIEENTDIAIAGTEIIGIGPGYKAKKIIDAEGRFVYPGLIDAHIHLESTKLPIPEIAKIMARFGTSAVITDPHEIGNVAALDGIAFQMDSAKNNGFIHVFFTAPSCVPTLPDPSIETAPSALGPDKLRMLAHSPDVVALGEVMNVPGILMGDENVLAKIHEFKSCHKAIDGHAPMLSGIPLNACIYMGIQSDHESTSCDEAREKLRRGMFVMIREGSSEKNLDALLPIIDKGGRNAARIMFASDDLDPGDLLERGHISHLLKRAVAAGIDPIIAIQMATITPANYFGLNNLGAIRPGACADLVISKDLCNFQPDIVIHQGIVVYQDGKLHDFDQHQSLRLHPTMHVSLPTIEQLRVKAPKNKKARLIELLPGQILTKETLVKPSIQNGYMTAAPEHDIAKVCVFERHLASGAFGIGFVRGLGIQKGAIGSSVGHDSHHLVVVGTSDEEILHCAQIIAEMGGGQAAVCGDQAQKLPLPIAGLISNLPAGIVVFQEQQLDEFCSQTLGITLPRPFAALSFISLPVIPALRLTDQGLFSIQPGGYPQKVDIFA